MWATCFQVMHSTACTSLLVIARAPERRCPLRGWKVWMVGERAQEVKDTRGRRAAPHRGCESLGSPVFKILMARAAQTSQDCDVLDRDGVGKRRACLSARRDGAQ
jgi:hypothetical protein